MALWTERSRAHCSLPHSWRAQPLTSSNQGQQNCTRKNPATTLNVSLCNWLFCAIPFHPMLQALSQASLPGSKYLASYRESFLSTFPARNSCSAVVYISPGCKMLSLWAILLSNSTTTTLNRGWKGFLLLWHGLACPEMGTPLTVWSAEQKHQTSWSGKWNIEEKEEPPHCYPDIVITEMNAGIFHTRTMEAHCKCTRLAGEVCTIE